MVHFNNSVQLKQGFHKPYVIGAKQQPGEVGSKFYRGEGTRVKSQGGNNLPNQANKQLSQEGTQSFNRYLMSTVLVWVPLEANPESRMWWWVVYLGGDIRKHWYGSREVRREGKVANNAFLSNSGLGATGAKSCCRTYTSELFHMRGKKATAVFTHQPQKSLLLLGLWIPWHLWLCLWTCSAHPSSTDVWQAGRHASRHGNGEW